MSALSPVAAPSPSVRTRMLWTLIALLPGAAAQFWAGDSTLPVRVSLALLTAIGIDAVALRLRAQSLSRLAQDGSAVVTAVLLALWLSPAAPGWTVALGTVLAIGVFKHAFGGVARELLHPAMAAFAVLIVLLPQAPVPGIGIDSPWVVVGYAMGGLGLLAARVTRWQTPLAVLGTAIAAMLVAATLDPGQTPRWSAATAWCLAAFFLATDPVTSCSSPRGRWLFGVGVALLGLGLQARGAAPPTAIAFALLLMNAAVPWIDRHTEPRVWTRPA
jgi:electron transport complex protein RnfD